jgi:bifunctional DNA-binding transcriptional regulator/antitoxin component of YhaV-PrlF toxin-antitoxin module
VECRSATGIKPGDEALIELVGEGELRLRPRRQAVKAAQSIVVRRVPKKDEEFGEFNPECLVGAAISAVNFSEVLAKLGSGGLTEAEADMAVAALDLYVIAFDEIKRGYSRSGASAPPWPIWPALALGLRLGAPVVTDDRA